MSTGIKEIAEACGLSANSVSDILNRGRGHLYREETAARVMRAAAEMDYRPNRAARSMRTKQARAVGFLAFNMSAGGTLENYIVYPFVVGMSHYFTDRGFHVSLVEMKELQDGEVGQIPEILRERYFDGLVVHYGVPDYLRDLLIRLQVPVIWWDAGVFHEFDCLYRDETLVAVQLTQHLVELGHRRIAFMVGDRGWSTYLAGGLLHYSYRQRYEAYVATMEAAGLDPRQIVGYEAQTVQRQLEEQGITAVITAGSDRLQTLTRPCLNLGWRIPEDLTVASCDAESRRVRVSSGSGGMCYDRYDAGQQAAAMLITKIEQPTAGVPSRILLGEFLDGETVGAPSR